MKLEESVIARVPPHPGEKFVRVSMMFIFLGSCNHFVTDYVYSFYSFNRNKVRGRIAELEEEVNSWKKRYSMLLERISALERIHAPAGAISNQAEESQHKPKNESLLSCSPIGELNQDISLKSSSSSLNLALNVPLELDGPLSLNDVDLQESIQETPGFHVIEMNSRPA